MNKKIEKYIKILKKVIIGFFSSFAILFLLGYLKSSLYYDFTRLYLYEEEIEKICNKQTESVIELIKQEIEKTENLKSQTNFILEEINKHITLSEEDFSKKKQNLEIQYIQYEQDIKNLLESQKLIQNKSKDGIITIKNFLKEKKIKISDLDKNENYFKQIGNDAIKFFFFKPINKIRDGLLIKSFFLELIFKCSIIAIIFLIFIGYKSEFDNIGDFFTSLLLPKEKKENINNNKKEDFGYNLFYSFISLIPPLALMLTINFIIPNHNFFIENTCSNFGKDCSGFISFPIFVILDLIEKSGKKFKNLDEKLEIKTKFNQIQEDFFSILVQSFISNSLPIFINCFFGINSFLFIFRYGYLYTYSTITIIKILFSIIETTVTTKLNNNIK